MRIAVLGTGAMGMLFAAMLKKEHDVVLLGRNREKIEALASQGVTVEEPDGRMHTAYPTAAEMGTPMEPVDLMIVFVKAMGTREALSKCANLLGEHTLLLSLQNGAGHEEELARFVPMERVLVGTTQHNASVRGVASVFHGGRGRTVLGSPAGRLGEAQAAARALEASGIQAEASANVRAAIWQKLLTNVSLSALTGVLRVPMGFVAQSPSAWALCETLIREACAVAEADGVRFDPKEKAEEVRRVATDGPMGITSICADLMQGRKTEVDTISGSVVRAAARLHVPAPHHEMMVMLIHAMEDQNSQPQSHSNA